MAAPQILSAELIYPNGQAYAEPGQTFEALVTAVDADNYPIQVRVTVQNLRAGGDSATVDLTGVVGDPIGYSGEATAPDGLPPATISQDPTLPGHFFITPGV